MSRDSPAFGNTTHNNQRREDAQVTPWSPASGSVGYLIATAHIGLAVFGEGKCWYQGELLPAQQALTRAGIPPYVPGPREGHALVGGTYEITALGCMAVGLLLLSALQMYLLREDND